MQIISITGQVRPTQVISKNKDKIGPLGRLYTRGNKADQDEGPASDHAAAALSAFWMSALVFNEPSIGSTP
jgi:hypothetical protein